MTTAASPSRRYLALYLPLLSTDRLARIAAQAGHAPDDRPVVTVAKRSNALRIAAADSHAHALGLFPGLAFADAKARVPHMRVFDHDAEADLDLLETIADWCDRFSPVIACQPPDMVLLDITGVSHLFGGEAQLLEDLQTRLSSQGFVNRTAIAGTARAARAHVRFGKGGISLPHEARTKAGPLPVEALECGLDTIVALRRAGLMAIGDFLARPRQPLAARFGADVLDALMGILEEIDRPLTPRRPLPHFAAEQRFADPIGLASDIELALEELADTLCRDLDRHGQGGRSFELAFYRADGKIERIGLLSGQPLKQPRTLKRLFEMRLESLADPLDPGFGFDMMRLSVLAGDPLLPEQSGLDGHAEAKKEVAGLIDRLSARFGAQAVQRMVAADSHLPERASRAVPAISDSTGKGTWCPTGPVPSRPLFLFYPAPKVQVVAEVPDGPPRRFWWQGRFHDVARAEGPERIAPEWWRATTDRRTRDYFRVEDASGQRFWLFRYGLYGREPGPVEWFLQGLFP